MEKVDRIYIKIIDRVNYGILTLATVEINPRSGPPDGVIFVTTGGGYLENCEAEQGWKPEPHQETVFGMFLLSPNDSIVLSKVNGNWGQIEHDLDFVGIALGPLKRLDPKSVPGWDLVGIEWPGQTRLKYKSLRAKKLRLVAGHARSRKSLKEKDL